METGIDGRWDNEAETSRPFILNNKAKKGRGRGRPQKYTAQNTTPSHTWVVAGTTEANLKHAVAVEETLLHRASKRRAMGNPLVAAQRLLIASLPSEVHGSQSSTQ